MEVKSSADLEREYLKTRSDLMVTLKLHFWVATCIAIVTFTMVLTLPGAYESQKPNQGIAIAVFSRELTLIATIVAYSSLAASVLTSFSASRQRFQRTSNLALIALVAEVIAFLSQANTEKAGSPGLRIAYFSFASCSVFTMVVCTWLNYKM